MVTYFLLEFLLWYPWFWFLDQGAKELVQMWSAQEHQAALLTCESEQIIKAITNWHKCNKLFTSQGQAWTHYLELILAFIKRLRVLPLSLGEVVTLHLGAYLSGFHQFCITINFRVLGEENNWEKSVPLPCKQWFFHCWILMYVANKGEQECVL